MNSSRPRTGARSERAGLNEAGVRPRFDAHKFLSALGYTYELELPTAAHIAKHAEQHPNDLQSRPTFSSTLCSDTMRQAGLLPTDIMDRAEGIVYMVINILSGARYVGATSKALERRWYEHWKQAESIVKSPLHYDIHKRGKQAFEVVQIASCLNLDDLSWLEQVCIDQYKPEYNRRVSEDIWQKLLEK